MYPSFTLMGLINSWLKKQRPAQRQEFLNTTIGEIQAEYIKFPLSLRWMENFNKEDREELAAGVFFFGRKYLSNSSLHPVPFSKTPKRKVVETPSSLGGKLVPTPPLTRFEKVMSLIDKSGQGLEIGPSYDPLAPKKEGFNVHVLDLGSAKELREKFKGLGVTIDRIEEVDFIWHGEPLPVLIGQEECYDWIIASHVIEHVPDMISFLIECEKLLKPAGVLSLIIPDKRFCFDYFHGTTSTGEILDAYDQKRTRPSPGKVFDHCARVTTLNGRFFWDPDSDWSSNFELVHDISEAESSWYLARSTEPYFDVHNWRFTPSSFRLLLGDLRALGLTRFGIKKEFDTVGCEFYVTLGKDTEDFTLKSSNRMELLRRIREDDESSN